MFGGESEILYLSLSVFLLLPLFLSYSVFLSLSLDWLPSHDCTHSKGLLCQLFRVHPLKSSASFVCIASSTLYSHRWASASESGLYCQKQNDVIYCGRQLSLFVHTLDLQTCCFCCFRSSVAYLIWCSRRDTHRTGKRSPLIQYHLVTFRWTKENAIVQQVFHLPIVRENNIEIQSIMKIIYIAETKQKFLSC